MASNQSGWFDNFLVSVKEGSQVVGAKTVEFSSQIGQKTKQIWEESEDTRTELSTKIQSSFTEAKSLFVKADVNKSPVYLVILGNAQDSGYPAVGCKDTTAWLSGQPIVSSLISPSKRLATCLGLVDSITGQRWLVDCTFDFAEQMRKFDLISPPRPNVPYLSGIFISTPNVGSYVGLLYFSNEFMGAHNLPVYCSTMVAQTLVNNNPWNKLISNRNIVIEAIKDSQPVSLSERLFASAISLTHDNSVFDCLGLRFTGQYGVTALYLPNVPCESWEKFAPNLIELIANNDLLLLDGTYYREGEVIESVWDQINPKKSTTEQLAHSNLESPMSTMPHPLVLHTSRQLVGLPPTEKAKIHFIHLNHSNILLNESSQEYKQLISSGFFVAKEQFQFYL
eukprot:TRINITY_DN6020_c2_g1_i1.p1 TRINITY_DN6020_c2_g1~~TRINITY_DN6020_c2_g1_i1.p1  ORF type:complete len:395 (-),score=187.35 TRINITY_DN6020_c2_g1_i1:79-1263(-)